MRVAWRAQFVDRRRAGLRRRRRPTGRGKSGHSRLVRVTSAAAAAQRAAANRGLAGWPTLALSIGRGIESRALCPPTTQ